MEEKINIPEDLINICRDIAKVAQKHNLININGRLTHSSQWGGDLTFNWSAGRHGEDSNELTVSSEFRVFTTVKGVDINQ